MRDKARKNIWIWIIFLTAILMVSCGTSGNENAYDEDEKGRNKGLTESVYLVKEAGECYWGI